MRRSPTLSSPSPSTALRCGRGAIRVFAPRNARGPLRRGPLAAVIPTEEGVRRSRERHTLDPLVRNVKTDRKFLLSPGVNLGDVRQIPHSGYDRPGERVVCFAQGCERTNGMLGGMV
jgi:hypothetical protein